MPQQLPPEFTQFIDKLSYNSMVPLYQEMKQEEKTTVAMINLIVKLDQATFAKLPEAATAKSSSALYACKMPRTCHISLVMSFHPDDEIVVTSGFNLANTNMARDFAILRRQEKVRIVIATDYDARIIHCNWKMEGVKLTELGKVVEKMGPCDWDPEQHMNLVRALNATYPTPKSLLESQRDSGPLVEVTVTDNLVKDTSK